MTTSKKRQPIVGYRTMTAAQRYNARMDRLFEECKDAQTRFNVSSRSEHPFSKGMNSENCDYCNEPLEAHADAAEEAKVITANQIAPDNSAVAQQAVDNCECDNTHYQNQTVCMPCFDAGIRFDTAYWPEHLKVATHAELKARVQELEDAINSQVGRLKDLPNFLQNNDATALSIVVQEVIDTLEYKANCHIPIPSK